jgi:hypothetical protein
MGTVSRMHGNGDPQVVNVEMKDFMIPAGQKVSNEIDTEAEQEGLVYLVPVPVDMDPLSQAQRKKINRRKSPKTRKTGIPRKIAWPIPSTAPHSPSRARSASWNKECPFACPTVLRPSVLLPRWRLARDQGRNMRSYVADMLPDPHPLPWPAPDVAS